MDKVLIIEDDKNLNESLKKILISNGYNVTSVFSFNEAESLNFEKFDIFLIDINLGYMSGFELFKKMKKQIDLDSKISIFLTARDSTTDNVYGIDLGADDYITKPFNVEILLSKIKNLVRKKTKTNILNIKNFYLDIDKRKLYKIDEDIKKEIPLTAIEYLIVEYFFEKPDWIISREKIKDLIYTLTDNIVNDNTISVYIKRIREKTDENFFVSIRKMGYKLYEKEK